MVKKKVLVWETLAAVSGGQKMTLTVMDLLSDRYDFCCLLPAEGMLADELNKRNIPYVLMGDQTLPTGVKGKQAVFRYGWMSVKNICKSLRQIRRYKPDLLYCPGPAALPWSAVCGSLTGKPVIWHLHHIFLDGPTKKLLNACGGWKSVKKVIAVSHCVGEQMKNPSARRKVEVLYNPVDVKKYANGKADKVLSEIEGALGRAIGSETLVIGQIALIQESKKQGFTLRLINALRGSGHDVIGVFAGAYREPAYMADLQRQLQVSGLEGQVAFLGRRDDVPDLLKLLDVLIIPSFEGFPLAGLEAAAAGVPVAACDVAGAEEFIRVSGCGACFREDDVEAAAAAVAQVKTKKAELSACGKLFAADMSDRQYAARIQSLFADT